MGSVGIRAKKLGMSQLGVVYAVIGGERISKTKKYHLET